MSQLAGICGTASRCAVPAVRNPAADRVEATARFGTAYFAAIQEILMDILRNGPHIEVIQPAALRSPVAEAHREAADFRLSTISRISNALDAVAELFLEPGGSLPERPQHAKVHGGSVERRRILETAAELNVPPGL